MKTIFVQEHIGPTIFELPDLDNAIVYEVKPGTSKPKAYCTNCKTNWACLYSESESEETYDFCPTCKTDSFLEEYHANEDGFIRNPLTGELKNVTTGKLVVMQPEYNDEYIEPKPFDYAAHELKKEREEAIRDLAIEEYQNVFALKGQQSAETAFFNKIQELKRKR